MRTRVKICGITRRVDGLAAAAAGADAVGLVFEAQSPRCVDLAQAAEIARALPPFVTVVGLFVDAAPARVREVLGRVPLGLLQFHGREDPEFCRSFSLPYIKAIAMREDIDVHPQAARYPDAAGLLFDTHVAGVAGGSGRQFDWSRLPHDLGRPLILAGGLTAKNVGAALRALRPYAVDVSSGVEAARGVKDPDKIAAFIAAVREAAA
jgi:phosphoribosylanthranilate isomerase